LSTIHDLLVIGAGPGGYVAAIRAAQLGLNVGLVEKEEKLGGTCLRVGCIPSKALLESSERFRATREDLRSHGVNVGEVTLDLAAMMERKSGIVDQLSGGIAMLLKKNKITHYPGFGSFTGPAQDGVLTIDVSGTPVATQRVLIATGSSAARLPNIDWDDDRIGCSTAALKYPEVPEHLVVIGAGAIGLELGSVWRRLGAAVTVLEYADRILPTSDREVSKQMLRILKKQGLKFSLKTQVTGVTENDGACTVTLREGEPINGDRVLVAIGRRPHTDGLNLDAIGLAADERGFLPVDDRFRTALDGVYAIGDVTPGPMLAHKAEEDGVSAVEGMLGGHCHRDYNLVPAIVYTEPEAASVGQTEEQLKESGTPYKSGKFPFAANGRALAHGHAVGFIKILACAQTDRVLGVHAVGPHVGELIAEAAAAMAFSASAEDIARTCHAHPTLAEVMKEAALAVDGRAIHA
jgi:dihydrolipoamide dehydrogenase